MGSTREYGSVSENKSASRASGGAPNLNDEPQGEQAGGELTWLRLQHAQFEERSASAVRAEDVPLYMEERRRRWPAQSGEHDEQKRAKYHRERQSSRGHEAITPGEEQRIPSLQFLRVNRTSPRVRRSPAGGFKQKVVHPQTRDVAYTVPTRWMPQAMAVNPRSTLYSTSISSAEHRVLCILWDSIHPWDFHVNGRTVVRGVTQAYMASICGLSVGQVSRVTSSLSKKGFITKRRDPDEENDHNRCIYHLTQYEYGHWTYPVGHSESGRARAKKIWKARRPKAPIEWGTITTSHIRRQVPQRDEAAKKLERDKLRRRTQDTGLQAGPELGAKIAGWMEEGSNAFHERGQTSDARPPDPGGGVDRCG